MGAHDTSIVGGELCFQFTPHPRAKYWPGRSLLLGCSLAGVEPDETPRSEVVANAVPSTSSSRGVAEGQKRQRRASHRIKISGWHRAFSRWLYAHTHTHTHTHTHAHTHTHTHRWTLSKNKYCLSIQATESPVLKSRAPGTQQAPSFVTSMPSSSSIDKKGFVVL
jgi:hypothetical protein